MTKKMRVRVSGAIMCTVMMITSISVFALRQDDIVPLDATGNGRAILALADSGWMAEAWSYGSSVYSEFLYTDLYGGGPSQSYASGGTYVNVMPDGPGFTYARSTHVWAGRRYTIELHL